METAFQWIALNLTAFKMAFTKTFALKCNLDAVKLESVVKTIKVSHINQRPPTT